MKIELEISPEIIANMMISAIESGDPVTSAHRGGWCAGIGPVLSVHDLKKADGLWYAEPSYYEGDFAVKFFEVVDESKRWNVETGENLNEHLAKAADFKRGFEVMSKVFPNQFAEVLADNTDAPCADAFLQSMLFGDEKYA